MASSNDIGVEITPAGIGGLDQADFATARPGLYLFLSGYGRSHVGSHFKMDEHPASVSGGKPKRDTFPVLIDPRDQIAGDTNVECAVSLAGHDVDGWLLEHLNNRHREPPLGGVAIQGPLETLPVRLLDCFGQVASQ
jgi:hypothetical protein